MQTPVLAMIVERDDTIAQFRAEPFWELRTRYREAVFKHTGKRRDTQEKAEKLLRKAADGEFTITGIVGKKKREQPPQLFDLTTLQRELNTQHGLSAAATLNAAQNLYESKLLTYPRTDSRYLSTDMKARVPQVMRQLAAFRPQPVAPLDLEKLPFTKRIVDDKKVTDHHAIIPTGVRPAGLGENERLVYETVVRQFLAAFYPVCLKSVTTVSGQAGGLKFQAKGTRILEPGWRALFPAKKKKESDENQDLPEFTEGESGPHEPFLHEGKTKPPSHFTENSLLGAMEAAGKLVDDDTLREALKERGIGTPATRASIIETLLNRGYIRREKKKILCTDMGRCLVALIGDPLLKSPEMTGEWEEQLKKIERAEAPGAAFREGIATFIRQSIQSRNTWRLDDDRASGPTVAAGGRRGAPSCWSRNTRG